MNYVQKSSGNVDFQNTNHNLLCNDNVSVCYIAIVLIYMVFYFLIN